MSNYIIKGPVVEDNVQKSIGEYFWRTADRFGDRICQIDADTGKKETFAEVRTRALRVAVQLRKAGVQPKDVVMVCPENDLDHIVPVLAGLFLGAYVACSAPSFEFVDFHGMIENIKPKAILTIDKQLNMIEEALKQLDFKTQLYVIGHSSIYPTMYELEDIKTNEEQVFRPVQVSIHDPAFIVFSSGTTSRPKGVYLSHLCLLTLPCRTNENQVIIEDKPYIICYTTFWLSTVVLTVLSFIFAMPRIVAPVISDEKTLELTEKYKMQHCYLTFKKMMSLANMDEAIVKKYDVSSMKIIFTSGMQVDPNYIKKLLRNIFPTAVVMQQYGMTEIGAVATNNIANHFQDKKLNSVGTVCENIEIKIVDLKTRQPLGPNKQGEILIKSPYRMIGFIGNQDSNHLFDEDGFYKSGDIGYYDEDNYFYYVDRLNDVFKVDGYKVYPGIVEELLRAHPAVQEAALLGMSFGVALTRPVAFIALKKGFSVSTEEISDYIVKNMGEICRPSGGVKFITEMPVTSTGKVNKRILKQLYGPEIVQAM